jgi:nucleoside-diphosphate-sugar epimerase
MKTALVIGGTRFIGKHLVSALLDQGVQVTIATRGRTPDPFGSRVQRVVVDRAVAPRLRAALGSASWDVCFDQICLSGEDALGACEALAGRVGRLVLTSSGVVYPFGPGVRSEEDFIPASHPARAHDRSGYEEGKRQAERALFAAWKGRAVAVRLPMILGLDDHTHKLRRLRELSLAGAPVPVCSADFETNYLAVEETAGFLRWVATAPVEGPINACSTDAISLRALASQLDAITGARTTFEEGPARPGLVSLAIPGSLQMSNARACREGFRFEPLSAWLPALLQAHQ